MSNVILYVCHWNKLAVLPAYWLLCDWCGVVYWVSHHRANDCLVTFRSHLISPIHSLLRISNRLVSLSPPNLVELSEKLFSIAPHPSSRAGIRKQINNEIIIDPFILFFHWLSNSQTLPLFVSEKNLSNHHRIFMFWIIHQFSPPKFSTFDNSFHPLVLWLLFFGFVGWICEKREVI